MFNPKRDKKNPYLNEDGDPILKKSVVAFVDILGYRERVRAAQEQDRSQKLLSDLHQKLAKSFYRLDLRSGDGTPVIEDTFPNQKNTYKIRTFSDCIVIGFPIRDDKTANENYKSGRMEVFELLSRLSFFQFEMVNQGIFVRGAIDVGDLYIDDLIIFGSGLVDAYETESREAINPRIILTKSAESTIIEHDQNNWDEQRSIYMRDLYKDEDGKIFVNYLSSTLIGDYDEQFVDELDKHKEAVLKKLEQYRDKPDILSKYVWVANYHNFFCDQFHFEEYHLDIAGYKMRLMCD